MKWIFVLSMFLVASGYGQEFGDKFTVGTMSEECLNNQEFLSEDYKITCEDNFHHYSSLAKIKLRTPQTQIRIGEFNALHPGMNKTRFKDYAKLAKLINQFDIIGVTELIPLMSVDLANNQNVLDFIKSAPFMIQETKQEIREIEKLLANSNRGRDAKKRELKLLRKKLSELEDDQQDAASLYRQPGYLRILEELHKIKGGKTWSLILSPRGEGSELTSTPELVGYYYRSDIIEPRENPYCQQTNKSTSQDAFACIVNMDSQDFAEDKSCVFARRPFLGQFKAGNFEFVLLTSHILYDSPTDTFRMTEILEAAFDTDDYTSLGKGLRKDNYARFAETKVTLEFISRYLKKYPRVKDVIYLGDFNLKSDNPFWSEVLKSWRGAKLYITAPTSLQENFFSDGLPSGGVSSNYDHILFNPQETKECLRGGKFNGGTINFMRGVVGRSIDQTYKVRYKFNGQGPIRVNDRKYNHILERFVEPYFDGRQNIVTIGRKYVTVGRYRKGTRGIIIDEKETEAYGTLFLERVVDSQLETDSFYYFYEQLISDHLPVYVDCKI